MYLPDLGIDLREYFRKPPVSKRTFSPATQAVVIDRQGNTIKEFNAGGNHHENWLQAVAARDASLLNGEILEGHLSSCLCHIGGISHQQGKVLVADAIAERIASNEMLSNAYDRMASHLRANDIDIDSGEGSITLGATLELDPATERFTNDDAANELLTRNYRRPFVVPDIAREAATASVG